MWLITLLLGGAVILLFNYWVNSVFNNWKRQKIPYSSTSPLYLLLKFLFTKKGLTEIMMNDYNNFKHQKCTGYFQFFTPSVMITDADLIHRICIKDFSYFVDRNLPTSISDLFTESVGSLTGDKWRTLRHKMTPTFTSGKLKYMFDGIKENCDEVVKYINDKNGEPIEARDFGFRYIINVIGKVSFGLKVDALNEAYDKENEFLNISRTFFQPSFLLMVKFMVSMTMPKVRKFIKFSLVEEKVDTFFRNLVKDMLAHREDSGELRNDFLQLMIESKKKEQEELHNKKVSNSVEAEDPEDNELLDQLKNMQKGTINYNAIKVFTEDCIIAQTFMFISAGSETTAATLSFILYELANHPKYQQKLQEEIDNVISRQGFTYQSLKNMTYMEQVINESMRLHTTAAFMGRVCTENYKVPGTDVVLEKGTFISIPSMGIMNDPRYFSEPDKFDPDRFEDMNSIHPGALLAFGAGPRMCIAKRLAMLQMKMLIATVLQHFTIKVSPKTKLPLKIQKASVFLHVEGGLWVQFEKRKK